MFVTVQIDTNTAAGKKLLTELCHYPEIVHIIEPDLANESLSANASAKLAFDRLGEKYNCKFNNKYTR